MSDFNKSPNELTLAILPFENLSEGKALEIFCRSFHVDLVTELSRFRQFRIIAAESLSGKTKDLSKPNDLKVNSDYLIRGSFRYHDERIRINAQLIKSDSNRVTWADRYEGDRQSIFSIQEDLLMQIVISLQQQLNYDLLSQLRKKSPVDLSVYEYWLYGVEELKKGSMESDERAREYFQRAIDIDPNYSLAYSGMSLTYFNEWSCQLWDRWEISQKGAFEWAKKAIELDEQNHIASLVLGRAYLYEGEFDMAEHYLRRALRLNFNDVDCLIQIASCLVFLGYPEEAETLYEKVLQLNPLNIDNYNYIGAFIALECGQFEKCVALGMKCKSHWVDFDGFMAAAYFHLDDFPNMEAHWKKFLQQFEDKILRSTLTNPDQAIQWMSKINPYKDKTFMKPFWEYVRSKTFSTEPTTPSKSIHQIFTNYFLKKNELWEISFEGKTIHLVEVKGFYDLVRLIENPGKQIHCTELIGTNVLANKEFVFDDKARRSYQKRIQELQEEIKWSEDNNDLVRTSSLQKEYDELVAHLSKSLGLGKKTRRVQDSLDKARSAITWRIRNAIQKIEKENPFLGRHLSLSIKTGLFCQYSPEKPVAWEFIKEAVDPRRN